jgi:hypothetical protein
MLRGYAIYLIVQEIDAGVLDYVCVSVCGLAPLLGCRPIRVRVSCVSIYCSPPLCNTIKQFTAGDVRLCV